MSDTIKFTQDELSELTELLSQYQQKVSSFGTLNIERISIEHQLSTIKEAEKVLEAEYKELQKKEKTLLDKLVAKYGEGSINIKNGTFTPQKS